MIRLTKPLLFVIAIFLSFGASAQSNTLLIKFSTELDGSEKSSFFCNDQIYANIVIRDITQDEVHDVRVIWRDPTGEDQEVIENQLSADGAGEIIQYIWLKLHRPRGAALFSLFDDTYGMTDFIGDWTLIVIVDDVERGRSTFKVHC